MTSHPHRALSAHSPALALSVRRFTSHPLALFFVLLIGAICVVVAPRASEGTRKGISATTRQASPTNLQGRQALDYLKQQGLYDRLSASIEASSYEVDQATQEASLPRTLRQPGGGKIYTATNRAQNLSAYFSVDRMMLEPLHDGCQAGAQASVRLRDYGYGERLIEAGPGTIHADGNRVEISRQVGGERSSASTGNEAPSRGNITEWYLNGKEGIEQGFTLDEPPGERHGDAPLRLRLSVTGKVRVAAVDNGKGVALKTESDDVWLRYDHLVVKDAKGRELAAKFETAGREISLLVNDADAVYPVQIDPLFTQTKKLSASDAEARDEFGNSVAISGDTIVVGSSSNPHNSHVGAAYVYRRNQGGTDNWGEVKKLTASDGAAGDLFGNSVAIDGDTVVVSADGNNSSTGAAYVYGRNQGGIDNWGEVKKLTASDGVVADTYGISVAISGDTVVVGAAYKNTHVGAAYVYRRNQGGTDNWGEVKKLTASDGAAGDLFGNSVAIDGDTVVVSAEGKDNSRGGAYVYSRNQGGADNWGEVKKLTASDGMLGDRYGYSVSICNDTVVVGAHFKNSYTGGAYVYRRNQGGADNWGEVKKLTASDGVAGDIFGYSVTINGDTIVIGAWEKNSYTGAVYVYSRNQGGADNWGEVKKLTASDGAANDRFGLSVSVSGNTIVIGAPEKNSNRGASYIFVACPPPTITNGFDVGSIPFKGTTLLTFAITNPNTTTAATGVGFTDTLPSGLTVADSTSSTCSGTLSATNSTGVISLSGASIAAGGTCQFSVTVTGTTAGTKLNTTGPVTSNDGGTGAASNTATLQVTKADQTITVNTHAPAGAVYNTQFTVAATASSGLPVTYSSAGSCTNIGATFTMTSGIGNCSVKYDQAGDGNYNAAPQVTEVVTAQKADQAINFGALSDKTFGDADFNVSATGGASGNAITFSSQTSAVCTVSGNTVTILSAGSCIIRASQAGDNNYNSAAPVDRPFTVNKANSTATITISDATFDGNSHGGTATVTGAGNLNQSLTITYTGRNSTVYSSTTAPTNAGDYTAAATFSGDPNHTASTDSQDFRIVKANQTITFGSLSDKFFGSADFSVAATASSGLSVTFAATGQCTVTPDGSTVHLTGAGSCTITASQAGSGNYNAAVAVDRIFNISKATPVITWNSPANIFSGTALSNTQLNATANVPGTFTYNPPAGTVLSVGAHQLSVTFTPTDTANYTIATANVSITIDPTAFNLDSTTYSANEGDGHVTITVNRTGSGAGAASVDYTTSDTAGLQNCNVLNGIASSRCDYATTVGTLRFAAGETSRTIFIPVVDDSYAEGPESFRLTLSNAQGENLGTVTTATVTVSDNETSAGANPISFVPFFVRQQYIDFLGREPDPVGFQGWQNILNNCAAGDTSCDRIAVSSGFFRSPEFQARGYFIFRFYAAALGRNPSYAEFMPDLGRVSGFLTEAELEANKVAYVTEFMTRTEFANRYNSLSNAAFVDTLIQTSGLQSHPLRGAWIDLLNNGKATKAEVLRAFTESLEVYDKFYNQAFVVMQYFGYLRRDPDAAYLQWIETLNRTGDYHGMISGFLNSNEYVLRFGP